MNGFSFFAGRKLVQQQNTMRQAILLMLHRDCQMALRLIAYFEGQCDIFIH